MYAHGAYTYSPQTENRIVNVAAHFNQCCFGKDSHCIRAAISSFSYSTFWQILLVLVSQTSNFSLVLVLVLVT